MLRLATPSHLNLYQASFPRSGSVLTSKDCNSSFERPLSLQRSRLCLLYPEPWWLLCLELGSGYFLGELPLPGGVNLP